METDMHWTDGTIRDALCSYACGMFDDMKRDGGSLVIKNTNVFDALETLRKKTKSDKMSKGTSKDYSWQPKAPERHELFWAPALLKTKSWAVEADEDGDDYYATTVPTQPVWRTSGPQPSKQKAPNVEETISKQDILDEGDEDEEEHEPEALVHPEPVEKKPAEVHAPPKEAEKKLSKKEKKKKELAELEALLADFGVTQKPSDCQDESSGVAPDNYSAPKGHVERNENHHAESKSSKKKKKKDKASNSLDAKESQDEPNKSGVTNGPSEVAGTEKTEEEISSIDVKERLKKLTAAKKKKSTKAAARRAKLAAAKKKEKIHYNQQPVR
ncbi:LOW QUALITY PROTEIN: uncharacterized protein LOC126794228 [Argentina anserina]|uniref:LOW QUALITY PROTEIN: uncharacterized protein LOC126794228 n=1 Tax=Argentina anserina TaxID=57926 RepID=UPI00217655FA|nr:LOW QUALITY PROTEIN: uncharacterized protein LOC126794228 [Potentilla anserina]